jgi:glutamyl-tRNA reductase
MSWILEHLQVIHSPKGSPTPSSAYVGAPAFSVFETCMRKLHLRFSLERPVLQLGDSLHQGESAYQFLLEVICGLHSSVVGETEVFGQFKSFLKGQLETSDQMDQWSSLSQILLTDCKEVRDRNLKGLGGNSYGSLLRKHLKNFSHIEILGAGALVQDVLPWISKDNKFLTIRSRNSHKSQQRLQNFSEKLHFVHWNEPFSKNRKALIIAAPLSDDEVLELVQDAAREDLMVFDMRDLNAKKLPFSGLTLKELCSHLESDSEKINQAKALSVVDIRKKSMARMNSTQNRPYGWEDFCF